MDIDYDEQFMVGELAGHKDMYSVPLEGDWSYFVSILDYRIP